MPTAVSFDITSTIDFQEVDNALNQARKEVVQRYDFKGAKADFELSPTEKTLTLTADDDFKLNALWEIIQTRLVRRGVAVKNFKVDESQPAAGGTVRRVIEIQQGIPIDAAREIVKFLKDQKLKKVQATIQADQVRVSSPSKDDLQEAMAQLRGHDFGVALQSALYISVRAIDPEPDRVVGLLTRRDDGSPSDWVAVMIDSYYDKRTAFEFGINAAGVKYDSYWFNDTNNDRGWDAVWDAAAQRSPQGWRAEFRIPFSQLRFKAGQTGTLGFAVSRTVAHLNETSTWPLLARSASGYVSSFGDLTGVTVAAADQKKLELMPYALTEVTTAPVVAGNPFDKSPNPNATVGLDLKYQVAGGLTLTGTVNPDFGQVEADPAVVNLGAFETFFPERRPFFVEGSGNFRFNIDCNDGNCSGLFYSRRIGRSPHRAVDAPVDGYASQPANSTIIGAAKLTGRIGQFSVGALNAVTANEDARIAAGASLDRTTSPVEPASNYAVVRASREFVNNSRLSFMMTSTNRRLVDELRFLPGAAVTGGVDADVRMGGGRYSLTGYLAGSTVRGSADAIDRIQRNNVHSLQRPDATHLNYDPTRTSLNGQAGSLNFNKISGTRTRGSATFGFKTPGFEINDLGFLSRADELWNSVWFQIRNDTPGKHFRQRNVNFNQWGGWNTGGDRRHTGFNINTHWTHVNNWGFGTGFNINTGGFDDRLTRGGPGGLGTRNLNQWGYFESDDRKRVTLNFFGSWFKDPEESSGWSGSLGVTVRANSALSINTGFDLNRDNSDTQWVENLDGPIEPHYVFGRINQTTSSLSVRVNYTIKPTLTLQIYGQPFVSAGDYSNFKELIDGRADQYADRYQPFPYLDNPDFNYRSFRTTNVLRWEYRPGSALFVVWQQGRDDTVPTGEFRFGDLRHAFDAPARSVFLVKLSHWLNF